MLCCHLPLDMQTATEHKQYDKPILKSWGHMVQRISPKKQITAHELGVSHSQLTQHQM